MDTQTFLDNFATIADAPGGIRRLRAFVLDLAVSGRLVPQTKSDEPVEAFLDRIADENASPTRSGAAAPAKPRFDIPASWRWLPLGRVVYLEMGQSPPSSTYNRLGEGMPFFQGKSDFGLTHPTVRNWCTAPTKFAHPGDVLISVRAPVGPTNIADQRCCLGRGLAGLRPLGGMPTRFLRFWIQGFEKELVAMATGTTFMAISRGNLAPFQLPIPPLAEQERIVAKLDELMRLSDEFEVRHDRHHHATTRFSSSALHVLAEAETPDDLRRAWERVSTNWRVVTGQHGCISDLRQTVLRLALAGRLTTSTPTDGTTAAILQSSRGEALDQPDLLDGEGGVVAAPYRLPETWRWVALGGVTAHILAGWSAPSTHQRRSGDDWAVLKVSACSWGHFRADENKALQPGTVPKEELEVRRGDFLISRANTSNLVARSVVVEDTPPHLMLSDKTLRVTPVNGCDPRYLNLANLGPAARTHYRAEATGTSDSMKNVSQRAIRRTPIPLPPRGEQVRIVAAVTQLNLLCDQLEHALSRQSSAASQLSSSITAE